MLQKILTRSDFLGFKEVKLSETDWWLSERKFVSILNLDNLPKCKSICVPPKDKDLDKIQYTLASKVGEERCTLPKCYYMDRHVTLA